MGDEKSKKKLDLTHAFLKSDRTARIFAVVIGMILHEDCGVEVHLDGKTYLVYVEDGHVMITDPQELIH